MNKVLAGFVVLCTILPPCLAQSSMTIQRRSADPVEVALSDIEKITVADGSPSQSGQFTVHTANEETSCPSNEIEGILFAGSEADTLVIHGESGVTHEIAITDINGMTADTIELVAISNVGKRGLAGNGVRIIIKGKKIELSMSGLNMKDIQAGIYTSAGRCIADLIAEENSFVSRKSVVLPAGHYVARININDELVAQSFFIE